MEPRDNPDIRNSENKVHLRPILQQNKQMVNIFSSSSAIHEDIRSFYYSLSANDCI